MGGLIILLGIVIASLFYVRRYPMIIPVLFVTLGFGFIGFIDDYIKVVMKRNLGTSCMAEDAWTDHSHRNLCVLFDKLHADRNFDADSFYTW